MSFSIIDEMSWTISSTYCVAWGTESGRHTPRASMASHQRSSYSEATAASVEFSLAARLMMLSSMSVIFETKVTSRPRKVNHRRATSHTSV